MSDLRESHDVVFFDDGFWKLLKDLTARALFPTANDRFKYQQLFSV